MTRIAYILLFLTTLFTGCQTSYTVSEKKTGFLDVKTETEDESINKMIQPYRDSLTGEMETVIGISEVEMKTGQPESLLGNFACDLVMQSYYNLSDYDSAVRKPTFSILNYRGLRAPLPKGEIKVKNIFEIMPFENAIVNVELKGSVVLEMTEFIVEYGGQPISSNCNIVVEKDKSIVVTIDGIPLDTSKIYTVITTDYLANGGDNMEFFNKSKDVFNTNYKLRDLLIDQIKFNTAKGIKNISKTDGRITFK